MLHAKFQDRRTSGSGEDFFKVFTIYGHGGHHGHVTMTFLLYIKFGFDWSSGFGEIRCLKIMVIDMYIAPGQRQTIPEGHFFKHVILMLIWSFAASFSQVISLQPFFHSNAQAPNLTMP